MAIRRRSSPGLRQQASELDAISGPMQQYALGIPARKKQQILDAVRGWMERKAQKEREKKAADKGGGPLGSGAGAGTGAIIGGLVGGPVGVAIGAGLGAGAGAAVGEAVDPAGSPEAYARGRQISGTVQSLAPLAGGVAGGFGGISPHESGSWGSQFRSGFGGAMSDIQGYAAANPFMAGPAGMDMPSGGLKTFPSTKFGSPVPHGGVTAGPGMKVTGYEVTPAPPMMPPPTPPARVPPPPPTPAVMMPPPAPPLDPSLSMYPRWSYTASPFAAYGR